MDRVFSNNLMALVPVYLDRLGDCTQVLIENKESFIVESTISTVLARLAKYYSLDLKALRKSYSEYISSKNLIPIAFDQDNIFIAFKARRPKYANDKSFGYLNLNYLKQVNYQEPIVLEFKDGQKLSCISKADSLRGHLRNGHIIGACHRKPQMTRQLSYQPTSSQDLNIIIRELGEIKSLIK